MTTLTASDIAALGRPEEAAFLEQCRPLADQPLRLVERLRGRFTPDQAREIAGFIEARVKAPAKFSRGGELLFTPLLLEQATSEVVADFKGRTYFAGLDTADLCCGAGGATLGLARHCPHVTAVDRDPLALALARHNLGVYGLADRCAFVEAELPAGIPPAAAYHFDPSRREGAGQRTRDLYEPPLASVAAILALSPDVLVKVSPLHPIDPDAGEYAHDIIALHGEVKEILLGYGRFNTGTVRAIFLPSGTMLSTDMEGSTAVAKGVGAFVFEPGTAAVKGGLVPQVAHRHGLQFLAPGARYLTGDTPAGADYMTPFKVRDVMPISYKNLNRYFKAAGVGHLAIKCKDSPVKSAAISRELHLRGPAAAVLFYVEPPEGARLFIIAEPVQDGNATGAE
ncbi:MAG: hypothetical protein ABIF71_10615 [Planctomycetota bacterium]